MNVLVVSEQVLVVELPLPLLVVDGKELCPAALVQGHAHAQHGGEKLLCLHGTLLVVVEAAEEILHCQLVRYHPVIQLHNIHTQTLHTCIHAHVRARAHTHILYT